MNRDDDQLARALEELPYTPPRADRMDELRASLGALPPVVRPRVNKKLWIGSAIAGVAAAAALAAIALREPAVQPAEHRAAIHAASGARFVHKKAELGAPEVVELSHGTVHVEVAPLAQGERMLLRTLDAELEVHGTRFDVVAVDDRLQLAEVFEGVVELRRAGELPVLLRAGSRWERPKAQPEPKPETAQVEAAQTEPVREEQRPLPKRKKAIAKAEELPAHERIFRDAWAAFARGDMSQAAELFAEAEAKGANSSLAEDAAYGRALALERAGKRQEAIVEMERFLARHPLGTRAGEVSVSLAWLLLDAGRNEDARAHFERAAKSSVPRIQVSAERGLESLRDPRTRTDPQDRSPSR